MKFSNYIDICNTSDVKYENLNRKEREIFDTKEVVIDFLKRNKYPHDIPILISETIRVNEQGMVTQGVYDNGKIIIKRSTLNKNIFLGVLIHEFAHYISGASDNTRAFEDQLTEFLGLAMNDKITKGAKSGGEKNKGLFRFFGR